MHIFVINVDLKNISFCHTKQTISKVEAEELAVGPGWIEKLEVLFPTAKS